MSPRSRRLIMVFLLILFLLSLLVEAADAQDATATPAGSVSQLSLAYEPTFGVKLMIADSEAKFFSASGYGGGSIFVNAGGQCISGYTSVVSSLGMVWVADSGPVDISFESTQPDTTAGIYVYDLMNNQFYCSDQFASTGKVHFTNIAKGPYFIWFLSEQPNAITGNILVATSAQTVEPTLEPTIEPVVQPTRGR